jgi:hypothetical protein
MHPFPRRTTAQASFCPALSFTMKQASLSSSTDHGGAEAAEGQTKASILTKIKVPN